MLGAKTEKITFERASEVLAYCPDTGELRWKIGRAGVCAGELAGTVTSQGYLQICIDYAQHRGHRLAWLLMTGQMPREIDHVDRNRLNNRWSNLREVAPGENQKNRGTPKNNTSGFMGVSFVRRDGTWRCAFQCDKRRYSLNGFTSAELASKAYEGLRAKYGRALLPAANDCPSGRLILSPVFTSSPGVRAVDSPSAGAAFPVAAQSLRAGRDPVTEFSHYSQIHK